MVAKGRRNGSRTAKEGKTRPALAALTAQHRKFVIAYLFDFNGARAALAAGYSRGRARQTAYDLVTKRDIQDAINEGVDEYGLSKPTVLHRFAEVFLGADLADFEDYVTGKKTLTQLRAEGINTRVLKGVRIRRTTQVKGKGKGKSTVLSETRDVTLNDPVRAGSEIARMLGYVIERHAHSVDQGWLASMRDMSDEQLLREAEASGMIDGGEARKLLSAGGNGGGR